MSVLMVRLATSAARYAALLMLCVFLQGASGEPLRSAGLGLPLDASAADVPGMQASIELGRRMFMDPRLSQDGRLACASCHIPEYAFAAPMARAIGRDGRGLRRNAPGLLNVRFVEGLFHDGRTPTLEEQMWGPLLDDDEMWNGTRLEFVNRLRRLPDYQAAFEQVFADGLTRRNIEQALAAYERSLLAGRSRFDRWYYAGEAEALSPEERRGFAVFAASGCGGCHTVGERSALFADQAFHNTGVSYARAIGKLAMSDGLPDWGRAEVTGDDADRWKFRTPSLRNVALTAPYMHDGVFVSLREVIDWYDAGCGDDPTRDQRLRPLGLNEADKTALEAFLRSLTGDNVGALAREARSSAHEQEQSTATEKR